MARYPLSPSSGQYKCLGSEFDAEINRLENEEDFKERYDQFHKRYPKADHYPYAYRVKGHSKSSDDGEPASSAGRPLLSFLEEKDVYGYVIVARYFGGTKLGIPRLRRSILEAASLAHDNGEFGVEENRYCYPLEVDYSTFTALQKLSGKGKFDLGETKYGLNVETTLISKTKLDKVFVEAGLDERLLEKETVQQVIVKEERL